MKRVDEERKKRERERERELVIRKFQASRNDARDRYYQGIKFFRVI